jgi:hypothetical protein
MGLDVIMDEVLADKRRIAELEATLRVMSDPKDYEGLTGFHSGVRSVYGQAVYEDRKEFADWMMGRWPAALSKVETEQ